MKEVGADMSCEEKQMNLNRNQKIKACQTRNELYCLLGKEVSVVIDRPIGAHHPKFADMVYPVNYGYVPNMLSGDGEEQDVYVLGVDKPLKEFRGRVVAIILRNNDNEDKLVVCPEGVVFTEEQIKERVCFQERYFDIQIVTA